MRALHLSSSEAALRSRAEQHLAQAPAAEPALQRADADALLQELRVHQIELEMQNEALRAALDDAALMRDCYQDLYDFAPVAYLSLDSEGRILDANLMAGVLLGSSQRKLLGLPLARFLDPTSADLWHLYLQSLPSRGSTRRLELQVVSAKGTECLVQLDGRIASAEPNTGRLMLTLTDITRTKHAEAAVRVADAAFEVQRAMMVCDAHRVVRRVNAGFCTTTGYSASDVLGLLPRMLTPGLQDAAFLAALWQAVAETGRWQGEVWDRRKNGDAYPAWLTVHAVLDELGVVTNYVLAFSDISMRRRAESEIRRLAFFDPITGLPNRRMLMERLQQRLEVMATSQERGALMLIDLGHLKLLEDTHGDIVNEALMDQVVARLAACVREEETVARLGGHEFVVLLTQLPPDVDAALEQAMAVAKTLMEALLAPYEVLGKGFAGAASMGFTVFGEPGLAAGDLMRQADLAIYNAKSEGRNRFVCFHPEMLTAASTRVNFEFDLRRALQADEFRLYYQPKVDAELQVTGVEALVRWQHPQRGLVPPDEFIPLAEEFGLMPLLGTWILEAACQQMAEWALNPGTAKLTMAVNVSARQLQAPDFVDGVLRALHRAGALPGQLKLELTESVMLEQVEESAQKMRQLIATGVRFALDDFGTGYSSLAYLKRLPFESLKIDRSFVRDMLVDAQDEAIVRSTLALAKSLGLRVVAEGVETPAQCAHLVALGCDGLQGYLFGKPMPAAQFSSWMGRQP